MLIFGNCRELPSNVVREALVTALLAVSSLLKHDTGWEDLVLKQKQVRSVAERNEITIREIRGVRVNRLKKAGVK